jgi:hypothetical protein
MGHLGPRPITSRSTAKGLTAILSGALLALALGVGPVGATILPNDRYADDYSFSFNDCGFWIDVTGHDEGVAHLRVGKGDKATAFFLHDNYSFNETWTRRDTGEFFTVSGNGLFHETKATHIEGTIYAFTGIESGHPFVVRDASGNVVVRDSGVIVQVIEFDTLGDNVPGGTFIRDVSFTVHGPHPGLDFDPCSFLG